MSSPVPAKAKTESGRIRTGTDSATPLLINKALYVKIDPIHLKI